MKQDLNDYVSGSAVATDLVNTHPTVRSAGDALGDPSALARFLDEHDLLLDARAAGAPDATDLAAVQDLRDELREVIEAGAQTSDEEFVEAATTLASRVPVALSLRRDAGGVWVPTLATGAGATLAEELAVHCGIGLLGAFRALGRDRFRPCGSPDCDGVFVDTSRAGRRRYCMPDLCGNRVNVARFRARRADAAGKG